MPELMSYHVVWLQAHPARSEKWLRERLADGFHVHHVDGNHSNDAPGNLVLMEGVDHMRLHGMTLADGILGWRKRTRAAPKPKAVKPPRPSVTLKEMGRPKKERELRPGYEAALAYGRELAGQGVEPAQIARQVAERHADQIGGWAAACSISRVVLKKSA